MSKFTDISEIEGFLYDTLNGKVSENTFLAPMPTTIKSSWKDLVMIDIATTVADMNAYGTCVVNVFMYSRSRKDGSKDLANMKRMQNSLEKAFRDSFNERFSISILGVRPDYDMARKMHFNVAIIRLTKL